MVDVFLRNLKSKFNIVLDKFQIEQFEIYAQYLISENKKYNLTSIKELEEIYSKHFEDSASIFSIISKVDSLKVCDFGTGAGFPGIVIKIINPKIELTLIDSNNKKISFLSNLINMLSLQKVNLIQGRIENLSKTLTEKFDIVTCRAVSELKVILEISSQTVKVGGKLIAYKSKAAENEVDRTTAIAGATNFKLENIYEYTIADNNYRVLVSYLKMDKTDLKFPRLYSAIIK